MHEGGFQVPYFLQQRAGSFIFFAEDIVAQGDAGVDVWIIVPEVRIVLRGFETNFRFGIVTRSRSIDWTTVCRIWMSVILPKMVSLSM